MTSSTPKGFWYDGRTCPDCEAADDKLVEMRMSVREIDRAGIIWDKWECPNCLYFEWEEIGETGKT